MMAGSAVAADSEANAEHAQALLGPGVWSRLIKIDNTERGSEYDRTVYATVFELAGILWFYTDVNGTQSLSLHRHDLVTEKADFSPLLKAICPGFVRYKVLNTGTKEEAAPDGSLYNGCFIESVAALRERVAKGLPTGKPQLLAYYLPEKEGGRGHTVLTYEADGQLNVLDPETSSQVRHFPLAAEGDARVLAAGLNEGPVAKARWLVVRDFMVSDQKWAAY